MPVIKSAKKKLKQDEKRKLKNNIIRDLLKNLVKKAKKNPTQITVKKAVSLTDKAAKKGILHKNKAARIKSKLASLLLKRERTSKSKENQPLPKKLQSDLYPL